MVGFIRNLGASKINFNLKWVLPQVIDLDLARGNRGTDPKGPRLEHKVAAHHPCKQKLVDKKFGLRKIGRGWKFSVSLPKAVCGQGQQPAPVDIPTCSSVKSAPVR